MSEYPVTFIIDDEFIDDLEEIPPMLGILIAHEIVFFNNHWWMGRSNLENPWPPDACETISVNVLCNDTFCYASADAEEISLREIPELFSFWKKDPNWGPVVWCCKKRGKEPLPQIVKWIHDEGIWDLNEFNLKKNFFNKDD